MFLKHPVASETMITRLMQFFLFCSKSICFGKKFSTQIKIKHLKYLTGRDESNLQELREVNIPNHLTGDFVLLENVKVPYQMIQISIKRCHSDGCDTRIRQIKGNWWPVASF